MRHIHVIGIGAGDPDYVTAQAVSALNDTQVFFAMDKAPRRGADTRTRGGQDTRTRGGQDTRTRGGQTGTDELVALRRSICERFIRVPGYRFVELIDPPRATTGEYTSAVADWHAERAGIWAQAIETELGPDGVGAFLVWGDPSLYDSTLRILDRVAEQVEFDYDVIPGITAIQALTARHRIPLNDIGEPVLITTGRRLREEGLSGAAVVMLDAECSFQDCPQQTRIWWGAYLGTPEEILVAGRVGEVGEQIVAARAQARERHGWIMDTYLLRSAD